MSLHLAGKHVTAACYVRYRESLPKLVHSLHSRLYIFLKELSFPMTINVPSPFMLRDMRCNLSH